MKNARHNISSHNSKFHRGSESAYKKDNASIEHKCKECGRVCPNFHTLVAHARKVHRFKGSSKVLKVNNAEHDGNAGNEDDVGNDDDADKESEEPAE
jgi:hypothetical protein